jgi:hypothetical protein
LISSVVANEGMIPNPSVIDFNGGDFEKKVALISKEKPVLVACASGGRSAYGAEGQRAPGHRGGPGARLDLLDEGRVLQHRPGRADHVGQGRGRQRHLPAHHLP